MNELQIFKNEEFGEVRTVTIDNEPWFVGKDVAMALGYQNASKALADHVEECDKLNNESLSSLGQRGGWLINESGLYALIFGSKLESAKRFKYWVTSEVLPAIRKTGGYRMQAPQGKELLALKEYSPEMRDEAFKRGLEEYKREIEFSVGLAYGDLSDVQEVAKTATEIKVSKNRKYNRVTAIQNNLYDCLEDFAAGLAFYNSMLNSGYEFSCKFNDSILTDEETERKQDMADVAAGFMHHWEYRMKWYGEDEETAKANVPEQNQVME